VKQWQTVQIPLAAGLDTKSDPRARPLPSFEILRDAEWEETGGLQTRKPYATVGTSIDGGGELAEVRRIFDHGGELLAFTRDKLYAWGALQGAWVERAEHLAVQVEEVTRLATPADVQAADRAELGGIVVYVWTDTQGPRIAVHDAVTGAALIASQPLMSFGGNYLVRPRCVALDTKILVVGFSSASATTDTLNGFVSALAIDPTAPAIGAAIDLAEHPLDAGIENMLDVDRIPGQDRAIVVASTDIADSDPSAGFYFVWRVNADLTFTRAYKTRNSIGPIAASCDPEGTFVRIVRAGTAPSIRADLLDTTTLADVAGDVDVQIGTTAVAAVPNQIAVAHRTVPDGGQYRCYAFWSAGEDASSAGWQCKTNWIDTGGTQGAEALFVRRLGPASRAFVRDGRVFVWLAFGGETNYLTSFQGATQNSYFLYRDDGSLHAKAVSLTGGGLAAYKGHLPHVQQLGDELYVWAAIARRVIPLGTEHAGYDAGAIREVRATFDADAARRTARLGATTYLAGGEILQYDGRRLTEVGYHVAPWHLDFVAGFGGDLAGGTYAGKLSWRWDNAAGERDRSASPAVDSAPVDAGAGEGEVSFTSVPPLQVTHKADIVVEYWRTAVDPTPDAPFFRVTSGDPADVGADFNEFVWNEPTSDLLSTVADRIIDADLTQGEPHPANGGYIEGAAPPAATIIAANNDRLFLAGLAGDPDRVWYSRQRGDGEVAAFAPELVVPVPIAGGAITGLGFLNDSLIVFRATAIYAFAGEGYDNIGGGANYGPGRLLASDVGAVNHESIALTPRGLVFKSSKGWYLVNRGWSLEYIGGPVAAFDDEDVLAVHVLEDQHQIRCVTAARVLVLDYSVPSEGSPYGQWSEWTIAGAVHALVRGGVHHVAFADDVRAQRSDYTGIDYGLEAKLAPIKLNELQGAGSVRWLDVLGEYRGACRLQVQLYRDYEATPYQTVQWAPTLTVVGGPLQVSVGPRIPKCMAIGVHLKAIAAEGDGAPTTEAIKLTGLALEVGIDKGINRRLPAGQKA
jgi:hypothetical protein